MKTDIGITEEHSRAAATRLNKLLADEFLLYTKTRNYHWNVEGMNFMELHKFYEHLYTELEEVIDVVAERIRSIGHYAQGRMKDFLEQTNLDEPDYTNDQRQQLQNLLEDHQTIVRYLRREIGLMNDELKDAGDSDLLTGLMKQHEKWAWFIRSYLN